MRTRGLLVAVLVGGLLGLAVVGGGALLLARAKSGEPILGDRGEHGVLVALSLPDANGTSEVRVIVYYPPGSSAGEVVDPLARILVPGTSASTLRDAFTFGSGASLARAYARLSGVPEPAWVVIDAPQWQRLAGGTFDVTLPQAVDSFNGRELVSFPAGKVALKPADLGVLLSATDEMARSERLSILGEAAYALQRALTPSSQDDLRSSLSQSRLGLWLATLPGRSAPETSTP